MMMMHYKWVRLERYYRCNYLMIGYVSAFSVVMMKMDEWEWEGKRLEDIFLCWKNDPTS